VLNSNQTSPRGHLAPQDKTSKVALALLIVISGLSAFLIIVGLPMSYASATESCSVGNPCVEVQQSGTSFAQVPAAAIPLLAGAVTVLGLVKNRIALSWAGLVGLLAFSFVSLFSVGLLYFPFAIALVAPISVLQSRRGRLAIPT
jgi:hypothetical protein